MRIPDGAVVQTVDASHDEQPIPCTFDVDDGVTTVAWEQALTLQAGNQLTVTISL